MRWTWLTQHSRFFINRTEDTHEAAKGSQVSGMERDARPLTLLRVVLMSATVDADKVRTSVLLRGLLMFVDL